MQKHSYWIYMRWFFFKVQVWSVSCLFKNKKQFSKIIFKRKPFRALDWIHPIGWNKIYLYWKRICSLFATTVQFEDLSTIKAKVIFFILLKCFILLSLVLVFFIIEHGGCLSGAEFRKRVYPICSNKRPSKPRQACCFVRCDQNWLKPLNCCFTWVKLVAYQGG